MSVRSRRCIPLLIQISIASLVSLLFTGCASEKEIQPVTLIQTSQTFEPGDTNQIGLGDLDVFISFYGDGTNSVWLNKRR